MKNLKTKLALFAIFIVVNCTFVRGQESDTLQITDTIFYQQNYLILTISFDGEEGFIVVGDTVKAVLFEINRLERENKQLKARLDNCYKEQVIQAVRNVEIFQDMLKLFDE